MSKKLFFCICGKTTTSENIFKIIYVNWEYPDDYIRIPEFCTNGEEFNTERHKNFPRIYYEKSVDQCKEECDADIYCLAFEYGMDYYQNKDGTPKPTFWVCF